MKLQFLSIVLTTLVGSGEFLSADELKPRNVRFYLTDFYMWCSEPAQAPGTTMKTIETMQAVVGEVGPDRCFEAQQALRDMLGLDLSNSGLDDLRPLSDFPNLKSLNLSGNQITDLAPIAWVKRLVALKVDGNPVTSLVPIARMADLQELTIEDTPLGRGEVEKTEANCPTTAGVNPAVRAICSRF